MNDRYLYRAKRTDNGEWVTGYYAYMRPHHYIMPKGSWDCWCRIDGKTLCQCTGVPDKNRIMIYENDIVWDSEERKFYKIIFSQEDMCYYVQDADGYKHTFESCYGSSIEVESNIFDNPELLEVES